LSGSDGAAARQAETEVEAVIQGCFVVGDCSIDPIRCFRGSVTASAPENT